MKIPTTKQIQRMSKKQFNIFMNEGLAEVCEDLATYEKSTPKQKKQFLKYADTFRKLGSIHGVKPNKSKTEVIQMGKRLTDHEKEERDVKKVLSKITKLEKSYPQHLVERACYRYKNANLDKRKAEKEMKELEEKLADAKKRLK